MKLAIGYLTIASAVSIAAATSCTSDVASPWPYSDDDESCATAACAEEQAYANCIARSTIGDDVTCVHGRKLVKRAVDLVCESSETCTLFTDNSLLCLEQYNGNFRDDTGGSGNVFLPIYTMPNGDVTTVTQPASTATAKADGETSSTPALVSTTRTGASQSHTGVVAAGTQYSGSPSSSSVNVAPSQFTGNAISLSGVNVALLAIAALPAVVAAI